MVILKNVKKTRDSISADYYPEGRKEKGFMRLNLTSGEVVQHDNADMFSAPHVRYELQRLSRLDNPPSEKTVIWY